MRFMFLISSVSMAYKAYKSNNFPVSSFWYVLWILTFYMWYANFLKRGFHGHNCNIFCRSNLEYSMVLLINAAFIWCFLLI